MKKKTTYMLVLVSLLFGVLLSYLYVNRSRKTADFSTDMEIVELKLDQETAQKVYDNFENGEYVEAMRNFSGMLVNTGSTYLDFDTYEFFQRG